MLKQKIQEILSVRQVMYDEDVFDLLDLNNLETLLTANFEGTLEFLENADQYEIMCASDVLVEITEEFPQYDWIKLFKEKADIITDLDSPHIDKEEYFANIEEAEFSANNPKRKLKKETLEVVSKVLTKLPKLKESDIDKLYTADMFDVVIYVIDDKISKLEKKKHLIKQKEREWLKSLKLAREDILDDSLPINIRDTHKKIDVSDIISHRSKWQVIKNWFNDMQNK